MNLFKYEIRLPSGNVLVPDGDNFRLNGEVKHFGRSKLMIGGPGGGELLRLGYRIFEGSLFGTEVFQHRAIFDVMEIYPNRFASFYAEVPGDLKPGVNYTMMIDFLIEGQFWFNDHNIEPFALTLRVGDDDFAVHTEPQSADLAAEPPAEAGSVEAAVSEPAPAPTAQAGPAPAAAPDPLAEPTLAQQAPAKEAPAVETRVEPAAVKDLSWIAEMEPEHLFRRESPEAAQAFGEAIEAIIRVYGAKIGVDMAYLHILGRRADFVSLERRTSEIESGKLTARQLCAGMMSSNEYTASRDVVYHRDPRVVIGSWANLDAE